MENKMPIVSICSITYNQEKYIGDAIEGFLMQKTTFPIEIIIHDDASTDNTAKIVKEYAEKYPELIIPIYQTVNQYSQGIKPLPNFVFPRARGEYIALCEGDDYWTDPYKLQKQVDFLEANPEYGIVHTKFNWLFEKNGIYQSSQNNIPIGDIYDELIARSFIGTCTVMVRNEILAEYMSKLKDKIFDWQIGDRPIWLYIASRYKVGYIKETTAVYRRHNNSVTSFENPLHKLNIFKTSYDIRFYFMEHVREVPENVKQKVYNDYYKIMLECYSDLSDRFKAKEFYLLLKERRVANFNDFLLMVGSRGKPFKFMTKKVSLIASKINLIFKKSLKLLILLSKFNFQFVSNKELLKFNKRIYFFTLPLIIGLVSIEIFSFKKSTTYSIKKSQLENKIDSVSTMILGPSYTFNGLNPDFFDISAYNLANNNQDLYYDFKMIEKYLPKLSKLKVVVFSIGYQTLDHSLNDGNLANRKRQSFYLRIFQIPRIDSSTSLFDYSYLMNMGVKGCFNHIFAKQNEIHNGWNVSYKNDEFAKITENPEIVVKKKLRYSNVLRYKIAEQNLYFLKEAIYLCTTKNIKVIICIPPVTSYYINNIDKMKYNYVVSKLKNLTDGERSYLLNLLNDSRFSDSDFIDMHHVNYKGCTKFSKLVNEEILRIIH